MNFLTKFPQERYLWSKTEKVNMIIEFPMFKLFLMPNFRLNWQFWTRFAKKGFFWTRHNFYIILLHIQISLVWNFSSNWQFWFLGPNLPKKVFSIKNWKSEHHHWMAHIQTSLDTKFLLKLIILIFLTRLAQKGFFWSKTEKVNTTYFIHSSAYSN